MQMIDRKKENGRKPHLLYYDFCHLMNEADAENAIHLQVINAVDIFTDGKGESNIYMAM